MVETKPKSVKLDKDTFDALEELRHKSESKTEAVARLIRAYKAVATALIQAQETRLNAGPERPLHENPDDSN